MYRILILLVLTIPSTLPLAYASETLGTIDPGFTKTRICHDATCTTYGRINWKPTLNSNTTGANPVTITETLLTGHIWGDEIGWVNLAPTGYGVSVDSVTGELSGYAYASVGGWINFRPTSAPGNPIVGVAINTNGEFEGWAYVSSTHGGWMQFDCVATTTCVKTDWRPSGSRFVPQETGSVTNVILESKATTSLPDEDISPVTLLPTFTPTDAEPRNGHSNGGRTSVTEDEIATDTASSSSTSDTQDNETNTAFRRAQAEKQPVVTTSAPLEQENRIPPIAAVVVGGIVFFPLLFLIRQLIFMFK